jgi:hypothetical protein
MKPKLFFGSKKITAVGKRQILKIFTSSRFYQNEFGCYQFPLLPKMKSTFLFHTIPTEEFLNILTF